MTSPEGPSPIVSPEIESDPLPKGADLQQAVALLVRCARPRLIADHFGIFAHDGHPHNLELIVEPELPCARIVLQFQFEQILLPALHAHLFPAEELRAERRRRMLARIHGSTLAALLHPPLPFPIVPFAASP